MAAGGANAKAPRNNGLAGVAEFREKHLSARQELSRFTTGSVSVALCLLIVRFAGLEDMLDSLADTLRDLPGPFRRPDRDILASRRAALSHRRRSSTRV